MNFGKNYINLGENGINSVPIKKVKESTPGLTWSYGEKQYKAIQPSVKGTGEAGQNIQPKELGYKLGKTELSIKEGKIIKPREIGKKDDKPPSWNRQPSVEKIDEAMAVQEIKKEQQEAIEQEIQIMSLKEIRIAVGGISAEKMRNLLGGENKDIFKNLGESTSEEMEIFLTTIQLGLENRKYRGTAEIVLNDALKDGGKTYNQATVAIIKYLYRAVRMAEMEGE